MRNVTDYVADYVTDYQKCVNTSVLLFLSLTEHHIQLCIVSVCVQKRVSECDWTCVCVSLCLRERRERERREREREKERKGVRERAN